MSNRDDAWYAFLANGLDHSLPKHFKQLHRAFESFINFNGPGCYSGSSFPERSSDVSVINHSRRFHVSLVAARHQVGVNKQRRCNVGVGGVAAEHPEHKVAGQFRGGDLSAQQATSIAAADGTFRCSGLGNPLFHHPADRWPDTEDVAAVVRYAVAFAGVASNWRAAKACGIVKKNVLAFSEEILFDETVEIVWVNRQQHTQAVELLQQRPDKTYSLCDAVSFILMRERRINEALTTDKHFVQEGFVRLLDP